MPAGALECTVRCIGVNLAGDGARWRAAALAYVSAAELAHAERFRQPIDATRHLVGRALLRSALMGELGSAAATLAFTENQWGKPQLPGGAIEFNIAHSGDAVWLALSRAAPVGIDVEQANPAIEVYSLAEMLHPAECAALLALPMPLARRAFLRCWSRKEAVLKALGEGLARPLASFEVATGTDPAGWLKAPPHSAARGWSVADLPLGGDYCASVAAMVPQLAVIWQRADLPDVL